MNDIKIQGIKDAIAFHERIVADNSDFIEQLQKELEEAQKPAFKPMEFVIRIETREQLMALGAVANRPHQVAAVALDCDGLIASSVTHGQTMDAVNRLLDPIWSAAYNEAQQ